MERKKFWVLIIEDEILQAKFCLKFLSRYDDRFEAVLALSRAEAVELLSVKLTEGFYNRQPVIILDYYLQSAASSDFLPELIKLAPDAMTIVVTAYETPNLINEVLSTGAIDYIFKTPDYYMHLPHVIEVAYERWLIHRELEKSLARSEQRDKELAAALIRLEQAQLELIRSEKMIAVRQLVSGITHELNNSLTSVIGFAQLLLNKQPGDRTLEIIAHEAEHARRIIGQLLAFGRQQKPERRWFDLNEMLKRLIELRSYQLKVSNIEIKQHLGAAPPLIFGDELQLQQAFLNLIINAEMALAEIDMPRRIEIKTLSEAGDLVVTIKDNGPGIATELLGKIFDPFFTTRPHGEGSGLGLSVCYGIIQEHHGSIEATGNQGACFTVRLPRNATKKTVSEPVTTPKAVQSARLLVADDEAAIRLLLTECLEREGYQIDVAVNGQEALEMSEKQHYDALIVDCRMPVIDGISFFHRLQQNRPALADRILFITGDVANTRMLDFLREVNNPHIVKPFNIDDVLTALRQLLDNSNNGSEQNHPVN